MEHSEELVRMIKEFCEENDFGYKGGYSGRNMYNKKCIGIVAETTEAETAIMLCSYLAEHGFVDFSELIPVRSDNIGRRTIVYFPNITEEE